MNEADESCGIEAKHSGVRCTGELKMSILSMELKMSMMRKII